LRRSRDCERDHLGVVVAMSNRHGRREAAIYSDAGVGGTGRVCLRSRQDIGLLVGANWEE
jgi:hypothetical protein